jgi:hypothetical protein
MRLIMVLLVLFPFILGEEVEPPYGCIEARRREVDC